MTRLEIEQQIQNIEELIATTEEKTTLDRRLLHVLYRELWGRTDALKRLRKEY